MVASFSKPVFYTVKLSATNIKAVTASAAPNSTLSSSFNLTKMWQAEGRDLTPDHDNSVYVNVALSVMQPKPAERKRATRGSLLSTDLGVAVHETLGCDRRKKKLFISMCPANITAVTNEVLPAAASSLLLSLGDLPLQALETVYQWDVGSFMPGYMVSSFDGVAGRSIANRAVQAIIPGLLEKRGLVDDGPDDDRREILRSWEEAALVDSVDAEGSDSSLCWKLTEAGLREVRLGIELSDPRKVLQRQAPLTKTKVVQLFF